MSNPNLKNSKLSPFKQRNPSKFNDDETIQTSNRTSKHPSEIQVNYTENKENIPLALNTTDKKKSSNLAMPTNKGIVDSGATGHFMLPGAPIINVRPTNTPIKIILPDGETIKSTHECELNIPALPAKARMAHIVPGLAHSFLISIRILCDAGCTVTYNKEK